MNLLKKFFGKPEEINGGGRCPTNNGDVSDSRDGIIAFGMTDDERERFGVTPAAPDRS
jgi:hypothetical protein